MTDSKLNDLPLTPVCAMGASAGGVVALQSFFSLISDDLGLAYVVIVHLAPDQPNSLAEILAARTTMQVHTVQGSIKLRPNCVYVIPPDRELVIEGDDLTARPFSEPRGRRSPIDMFFRSIAAARGDRMAVVLSGSGSDGALGVRAIKEAGGVIFAQDPNEADYMMMPQAAIGTGVVDFVSPIPRLVTQIADVMHSMEAMRALGEEVDRDARIYAPLAQAEKVAPLLPRLTADHRLRVLVVDDNADVADGFSMLLKTLGVNVRSVYNGPDALTALKEFKPDMSFVDLGMPGMDGYEVARAIRATPEGKNLFLVALSGWGGDEHRRRGREAGFDRHYVKPIDIDHIEVLLGEAAERKP